jgi:oligosaccharide repeat unit polymerase
MIEHPLLFWALIVDILVWVAVAHAIAVTKKNTLHIGVIFSGLFILSYPLKFLASFFGFSVMNPLVLSEEWLWLSFLIFNISGVMFLIPMLIVKKNVANTKSHKVREIQIKKNFIWPLLFFALIIIGVSYGMRAIDAVFSFSTEIMHSRIAERADERLGSGPLVLLRTIGEVMLALSLFRLAELWLRYKKIHRILVIILILLICLFLLVVSGSKHQGLMPLCYFIIFLNIKMVTSGLNVWSFSTVSMAGLIGLMLVGIFGVVRGLGGAEEIPFSDLAFQVFIQLSNAFDAPDNLSFILSRVENIWFGDLYFEPTIQYIVGTIPRFLWPDKPVIMGNLFIQEIYLYERFTDEMGEVISPSMPGEMIVSGGIIFMSFWSLILGLFYAFHTKYAYQSNNWVWKILYAFLVINVFNILRSGTGFLAAYILFSFAVFIIWLVLKLANGMFIKNKRRAMHTIY